MNQFINGCDALSSIHCTYSAGFDLTAISTVVSSKLTDISIAQNSDKLFEYIAKNCVNLTHFNVSANLGRGQMVLDEENLLLIIQNNPSLVEVELMFCSIPTLVLQAIKQHCLNIVVIELKHCSNEVIDLHEVSSLIDTYGGLTNVYVSFYHDYSIHYVRDPSSGSRSVSFSFHSLPRNNESKLSDGDLLEFLNLLPANLTKFFINECKFFFKEHLACIVKRFKYLQVLQLVHVDRWRDCCTRAQIAGWPTTANYVDALKQLPKLQMLYLNYYTVPTVEAAELRQFVNDNPHIYSRFCTNSDAMHYFEYCVSQGKVFDMSDRECDEREFPFEDEYDEE